MHTRLAIPLRQNQTRQASWRVVGALALIAGATIVGFALYRFFLYQSTPVLWPAEATSAIRLIKTPHTQEMVRAHFATTPAIANAPWTIEEGFSWTDRQFVVFFQDDVPVALVIDGKLPVNAQILQEMGLTTQKHNNQTLLYRQSTTEPQVLAGQFAPRLLLPWFQGLYVQRIDHGMRNFPFSLTKDSLKIATHFSAKEAVTGALSADQETTILASVHVTASLAATYLPEQVPLTLPGFSVLLPHLREHGFDFMIGEDTQGVSVMLATVAPNLSLETMGAIAREGLQSDSLSTIGLTLPNLMSINEIRSLAEVEILTSSENGLNVVTAKDTHNRLFRLTQSDEVLILSNRPPVISPTKDKKTSCLAKDSWFIRPQDLLPHLPPTSFSRLSGVTALINGATEVAWNKKWLKICW